jgi:hypothetical protein
MLAPVFEPQAPAPAVPLIVQLKLPVGGAAFVDPVTVAVTVSLLPKIGALGVFVRITVGVACPTTVTDAPEEVDATKLYEVSPVKMKFAP